MDEASLHKVSEAGDLGSMAKQMGFVAMAESEDSGASDSARSLCVEQAVRAFGGSTWLL